MLLSSIAGNTSLSDWVVSTAFCPQPAAMMHKTRMAIAFAFFILLSLRFVILTPIKRNLTKKVTVFLKKTFKMLAASTRLHKDGVHQTGQVPGKPQGRNSIRLAFYH